MARMDGVVTVVSTSNGAEPALRLPAPSTAVAVKAYPPGGPTGPARLAVQVPVASVRAVATIPAPARSTSTVLPASAVPRTASVPSSETTAMTGAAGALVSTVTVNGRDEGPVRAALSVAVAVKRVGPSGSAVPE